MFAIIYETQTTGFYLGSDINLGSAESRFRKIRDDLLENISKGKAMNSNNFFTMYGVFNIAIFCTDYECYRIATHKNQITKWKSIFQIADFYLYIIEIEKTFDTRLLKRNENYFYSTRNRYIEGIIELIIN